MGKGGGSHVCTSSTKFITRSGERWLTHVRVVLRRRLLGLDSSIKNNLRSQSGNWDQVDQITKMYTCYIGYAYPITEEFKYDPKLRLVEAKQPTGTFSNAGGAYGLRQYQYDRAGNRTLEVDEKVSWYCGYANYTRLAKKEWGFALSCGLRPPAPALGRY